MINQLAHRLLKRTLNTGTGLNFMLSRHPSLLHIIQYKSKNQSIEEICIARPTVLNGRA